MRSSKIVLEANPGYREVVRDGERLPRIGGVEISIMEETQSRWLAFQRGETDMEYQLAEVAPTFITPQARSRPELARRGIQLERSIDPEIIYLYFNMQDKTVGGLAKEKIALRRAIAMAYRIEDQIRIIRKGQSIRAHPIRRASPATIRNTARASSTTRARRTRCSTSSATGAGRTGTGACRTASRSSSATPRRRASATGSSTS